MAVMCLHCRATSPTLLIWNNLCDLVHQLPTKTYRSQTEVVVGIPGHVTTKHLPDTPCWATKNGIYDKISKIQSTLSWFVIYLFPQIYENRPVTF